MYLKLSFEEILPIARAGKIKAVFHVFASESRFGMTLFYKTKSYKKSKSLNVTNPGQMSMTSRFIHTLRNHTFPVVFAMAHY